MENLDIIFQLLYRVRHHGDRPDLSAFPEQLHCWCLIKPQVAEPSQNLPIAAEVVQIAFRSWMWYNYSHYKPIKLEAAGKKYGKNFCVANFCAAHDSGYRVYFIC